MTASPSDPNPGPGPTAPALRPLARLKPYKAAWPEDTVNEIRSRLARWGMAFVEEEIGGESGRFSCALRLVDAACGAPVFQTIGKGRTDAYAKASAYGEMIERIQNLAFYMMLLYPSEPETEIIASRVPFRYFPDEKILSGEERERGFGRLFYFRPGHEAFPTFCDGHVLRVLANGIRWLRPTVNMPYPKTNVPVPLEPVSPKDFAFSKVGIVKP